MGGGIAWDTSTALTPLVLYPRFRVQSAWIQGEIIFRGSANI